LDRLAQRFHDIAPMTLPGTGFRPTRNQARSRGNRA
jgi:hypothetical protein